MSYIKGGTYGICDRCGFRFRLRELRKEWTGLMVCVADFDPRPPETRPAHVEPEGLPLPNARPDHPAIIHSPSLPPERLSGVDFGNFLTSIAGVILTSKGGL